MSRRKCKVFVTRNIPPKGLAERIFLEAGLEVRVGEKVNEVYSDDELIAILQDTDALFVPSGVQKVTRRVIESSPQLKVIGRTGVGIENVDIQAATEKGILVTRSPVNFDAVAELTVALIICSLRKIINAVEHLKTGRWGQVSEELLGHELLGKTIGIIGLGRIGSKVAIKLKGFEVKILGYDPYVTKERADQLGVVKVEELETLLAESDIVTLHLTMSKDLKHWIGEKQFKLMKPTAYIINTSRGGLIDEKALYSVLKEKRIAGAALDVHEQEPINVENPLYRLENITATPHIGGACAETRVRSITVLADNIIKILRGERPPLEYVANPEVFSKVN